MGEELNLFEDLTADDVSITGVIEYLLENRELLKYKKEELQKRVMEKFLLSSSVAAERLSDALREIKKIENKSYSPSLKKALQDRELIFIKAMKSPSGYRTALEAAKDRDLLKGLYDNSITLKGILLHKEIDFNTLTNEQLERIANGESPEKVITT